MRNRFDGRFVIQRARLALLCVPFLWVAFGLHYSPWTQGEPRIATDSYAYYHAARDIRYGGLGYDPLPPPGPHVIGDFPYYVYPPPLASFIALADLGSSRAHALIVWLGVLGSLAFAWGLTRIARTDRWSLLAFWAALLMLQPYSGYVAKGNIHGFTEGLWVLGLTIPGGAGLVAAAAMIKVTPIWALIVLLVRAGRQASLGAAAALLVGAAGTLAALGPARAVRSLWVWSEHVAPTLQQGQFGRNLSPAFLPVQLLMPHSAGTPLPGGVQAYLILLQIGVPLTALWLARTKSPLEQAAWVMAAATLAAPIVRLPYLTVLLLMPAMWLRHMGPADSNRRDH